MKINYISSFASEEIETPDDENGFYRQLAKKMASEQPPCTVKIQTPYGNASYGISNRSGTILIQESSAITSFFQILRSAANIPRYTLPA